MKQEDYLYLENKTILNDKYIVLKNVSERSNFSIVYLAKNIDTEEEVIIKEFFPKDVCLRDMDKKHLICKKHYLKETFELEKKRFLNEASIVDEFHPNLSIYYETFNENGTSYIVMKYYEGNDLEIYLKKNLEENWYSFIKNIIFPIIDGLSILHKKKIIHRDLKPSNILLTNDNIPVLIDFGSAIYIEEEIKKIFVTPGFSPIEFYAEKANQTEKSDIYSLTAIIYYYFLGVPPKEATSRILEDKMEHLENFPKFLGFFMNKNLNINAKKRDSSLKIYKRKLKFILILHRLKDIFNNTQSKWRKNEILQDL